MKGGPVPITLQGQEYIAYAEKRSCGYHWIECGTGRDLTHLLLEDCPHLATDSPCEAK